MSSVAHFTPQAGAVSFTKPTQSSLWITAPQPWGFQAYSSKLATNLDHNVVFVKTWLDGFSDKYSTRQSLLYIISRKHDASGWGEQLWQREGTNTTSTFSGAKFIDANEYLEGDFQTLLFIPYNGTGFIADFSWSALNLSPPFSNFTALVKIPFQFGNMPISQAGQYMSSYQTGNTTAHWNLTLQAIVASSASPNRDGYVALKSKLLSDTTGNWNFTYGIWNKTDVAVDWTLTNGTVGDLPTTSTNVVGALAYSNEEDIEQTLKLHFAVYVTFGSNTEELQTRLTELTSLDIEQSYADSNTYWYNLYTQNSAVNFGNQDLNTLYYWSKHLINVGFYGKRYFLGGVDYGLYPFTQDSAYTVFSSMASGLWDEAKTYLDNTLDNWIYMGVATGNEFNATPYAMKYLVEWNWDDLYGSSSPQLDEGSARGSLDTLDAIINYISWSGNVTYAQNRWISLTNMMEVLYSITTNGVLPLTQANEDVGSSLQCNIIFYKVLDKFADISNYIGNSTYATTLRNRATTLKTQLNKEVGSGGLWSSLNGYFVNSSWVSPTDPNPLLWLWHNSLAISYDVPNNEARKTSILTKINQKLESTWGFIERQGATSIWYMKQYELAKAFAFTEDSSKIDKIVWSHINNPYAGIPKVSRGASETRSFIFPEYWTSTGISSWHYQYAWSSSPATMTVEVLLGIKPTVNNIKIQPIKPSNVSTITAINVKVRNALWNVSVTGNGNYVNTITIDGAKLYSQVIPDTFLSGSHTVEVTLGNKPSTPFLTKTTAQLSSVTYENSQMTLSISAPSSTTTSTTIYVGEKGKPTKVYINNVEKYEGDSWSFQNNVVTFSWLHSSGATLVLYWGSWNPSVNTVWLVLTPILFLIGLSLHFIKQRKSFSFQDLLMIAIAFILATIMVPIVLNILYGGA